jgi:hypothetical protein
MEGTVIDEWLVVACERDFHATTAPALDIA